MLRIVTESRECKAPIADNVQTSRLKQARLTVR